LSGLADVNVRYNSRFHLVRPRDIRFNRIGAGGTNKVYRASTKTTTRHASAMDAKSRSPHFDQKIKFLAAYFVVIAQAGVRLVHQMTEPVRVTRMECLCCG